MGYLYVSRELDVARNDLGYSYEKNRVSKVDKAAIRFFHGDFKPLFQELSENEDVFYWSEKPICFEVCAFLILDAEEKLPVLLQQKLLSYAGYLIA